MAHKSKNSITSWTTIAVLLAACVSQTLPEERVAESRKLTAPALEPPRVILSIFRSP